jgi:endonuclease-8
MMPMENSSNAAAELALCVPPFRKLESLSISQLCCVVSPARKFLLANLPDTSGDKIVTYTGLRRTIGRTDSEENLWVYGRRGEPCRRCGAAIESRKQGVDARTTSWCSQCQRFESVSVRSGP